MNQNKLKKEILEERVSKNADEATHITSKIFSVIDFKQAERKCEGESSSDNHSRVKDIIYHTIDQVREEEYKKVLDEVVRLKSRSNVSEKTSQYTQELDEAIAFDDGYMNGLSDLVQSLIQKNKE